MLFKPLSGMRRQNGATRSFATADFQMESLHCGSLLILNRRYITINSYCVNPFTARRIFMVNDFREYLANVSRFADSHCRKKHENSGIVLEFSDLENLKISLLERLVII